MSRFRIDHDAHVSDFCTIPPGDYRVRVAEVRPGTTRDCSERWSLRLVVLDGEFAGRQAAWASIVWRGLSRDAMAVCRALGARGKVDDPFDLEGRCATVSITPCVYTAPGGESVRRNEANRWRSVTEGRP